MKDDPALSRPLVPGEPVTLGEARYLLAHERVLHLSDLLIRRTRLALCAPQMTGKEAAAIATALAPQAGWDVTAEVARFLEEARQFSN
jgi:glycerol-3-phosphate dehydrogenase